MADAVCAAAAAAYCFVGFCELLQSSREVLLQAMTEAEGLVCCQVRLECNHWIEGEDCLHLANTLLV